MRIAFHPAVLFVKPAAVGPLAFGKGGRYVRAPVVLLALGVRDLIDAQHVQAFGHRGVVVVQSPLRADLGHAGVAIRGVVLANPFQGFFHARVVLTDTAINQALDSGIGHAAVTGQAAIGVGIVLSLGRAAGRGAVDEGAVVDFAGPGLVVALALEVLAAADE